MEDTMRNQLLYILLAFLCLPFQVFAMPNDSVRLVLEELDAIIDQKDAYHDQKEKELEAWKLKLRDFGWSTMWKEVSGNGKWISAAAIGSMTMRSMLKPAKFWSITKNEIDRRKNL